MTAPNDEVAEKTVGICIVSDLHAGQENTFPELRPGSTSGAIGASFGLEPLANAMAEQLRSVRPDRRILVCPGDLSSSCHSAEIERAAEFLTRLAERLSIPEGHRLLVPGNHDIDWHL